MGEANFVHVTDYISYNSEGQLEEITTDSDPSGGKPVTTTYDYNNPFGNLSKTTTSATGLDDRFTNIEFDAKGRFVTKRFNALGHSSTMQYEPAFGNLTKQTTADGLVTINEYDAFGRLTKTITPEGNTISTSHGWVQGTLANAVFFTHTTAPGVPDVKVFYDILGRKLRSETDGFSGTVSVDRSYNARGELTSVTYPRYDSDPVKTIFYTYHTDFGYRQTENNIGKTTTYSISGTTISVTNPASQTFTRTIDGTGAIISATDDAGGTVSYNYFSNGQPKSISAAGTTTTMEYDEYARQTKLTDPNAGETTYEYNAFGELTSQEDANGNIYNNFQYDQLGRIKFKTGPEGVYSYIYVTSGNGLGNIQTTTAPNTNSTTYEYDQFARAIKIIEKIDGQNFGMQYEYDNFGNTTKLIYPSGYTVQKTYDNNGYLAQVNTPPPQGTIFTSDEMNAMNQYTKYTLGNGAQTENTYNDFGMMSRTTTASIQDNFLGWNTSSGNLNNRVDIIKNIFETNSYDNLNRLKSYQTVANLVPGPFLNVDYQANGNIFTKTDAGNYTYDPSKPHAVVSVTDPDGLMPLTQNISYTPFKRPATITHYGYELVFTYGPEQQRKKSVLKNNNVVEKTIIYAGNYEKITIGSDVYEVHYLGNGAINVRKNGTNDQLFYTYTDHLGSILTLTNASGNVVYEQSFDPWGRKRDPNDWDYDFSNYTPPALPANTHNPAQWLIRGFTGHEHHPEVQLINMNARMYDPIVARVLSPDNFVQDVTNTQGYNRYSYALNNPLVYTDPDGEFIQFIIGGVIGGFSGYQIGKARGATGWEMVGYIFGGAAIGAVSGGVGSAVTSAIGTSATVAYGGLIATGVGGATAGAISGAGFAALGGGNVGEGLWKGAVSGLAGGLVGGYVTGGAGAFLGGATSGAVGSALNGGDLNEIGMSTLIGGGISFGSYQLQSAINYSEYKESGGTFTRKQFNAISRSAQKSFTRGREYGGWLTAEGGVEMFPSGQQAQMQPQAKPQGATGFFHTHPNTGGNWVEIHSPADINFNNNLAEVPSLVVARQNAYMQLPGQNASLFSTNKIFNPYPFNYYWFR